MRGCRRASDGMGLKKCRWRPNVSASPAFTASMTEAAWFHTAHFSSGFLVSLIQLAASSRQCAGARESKVEVCPC